MLIYSWIYTAYYYEPYFFVWEIWLAKTIMVKSIFLFDLLNWYKKIKKHMGNFVLNLHFCKSKNHVWKNTK